MMSKGLARAYDDLHKIEKARAKVGKLLPKEGKIKNVQERIKQSSGGTLYVAKRGVYLESVMGYQKVADRKQLLTTKAVSEWESSLDNTSNNITRIIMDGIVNGKSNKQIEKEVSEQIDKDMRRSVTVINENMVHSFTDGQLEGMEAQGVKEVGIQAEWATAGDNKVCSLCKPLEGILVKISQARGMLPRHVNCRCAWIPANVGESNKGQKTTPKQVNKQIQKSANKEKQKDVDKSNDPINRRIWSPKPQTGSRVTRNNNIFLSGTNCCTIEDFIYYANKQNK